MKLLNRLERKLAPYSIENVTLALVILQGVMWVVTQAHPEVGGLLYLDRSLLPREWWRLFSFIILPPSTNVIFIFFALWLLYLMGTALESHWGAFRFNLYLLIGYLATIASIFIAPEGIATNGFLMSSIFLAFAYLYPEFQIMLFFIIPVKVKWLALITWIFYLILFATGDWLTKMLIVAAVSNFLLFFGRDIFQQMKLNRRQMARKMVNLAPKDDAINCCIVCGVTEKTDRRMEFRYCPECAGTPCYCIVHLLGHVHRK
jgi:hypothetical protein